MEERQAEGLELRFSFQFQVQSAECDRGVADTPVFVCYC
jgi:hypothetical protein